MAAPLKIFSIYKLKDEAKYYLLRTTRPDFSNASQNEQDAAENEEQNQRDLLLKVICESNGIAHSEKPEFIGELQNLPIGDVLFTAKGQKALAIYYINTAFGHPWIILGNANSEEEFLSELEEDDELLRLNPLGQPIKITVDFITEEDTDGQLGN